MTTANSSCTLALRASAATVIEIDRLARWEVYHRLQALSIPCTCKWGEPLRVQIDSPGVAIQLWCVVLGATATRQDRLTFLEQCWHR